MRVLICIKGGSGGEPLLNSYGRLFHKSSEDEVIVLHVARKVKLPTFAHGGGIGYVGFKAEAVMRDWRQNIEEVKKNAQEICVNLGMRHKIIIRETEDNIGEAVVQAAENYEVNLIVLGSRGLGLLGRIFLGTVDDYVKTHTAIPTLIHPSLKT